MGVIIVGVLLIAAGVAGFFFMQRTKSELHAMIGTETLSIPQLEDLRRVSDELGARGAFRKTAEVVGMSYPRPEGLLISELSKSECVWYRYEVQRQYERVQYRDGRRRRSTHWEKVAEGTSFEGYALVDEENRTIGVDPAGAKPEGVEKSVDRFEPHSGSGNQSLDIFGFKVPNFLNSGNNSTIGFQYKEWIIRPGRRMYILGEVHDKIGPLVIGKPAEGHYLVATGTEEELRANRTQRHKFLAIGVIAAVVIGIGVTVFGILK